MLFGITFVVVKQAITSFPPIGFVAWRFLIGGAALAILSWPKGGGLWKDGIIAGVLLWLGYTLQTVGLASTTATNSALVTGLYVVITPLLVAAWRRKAPSPGAVIGTVFAFIGVAMLTLDGRLALGSGDLLTVGCAFAFAGHIVFLSRAAPRHPVVAFTAVQMLTTAALAFLLAVLVEGPPAPSGSDWLPILVTGLGVSAVAYLLQVWAQTEIGPAPTAVVLTLEPVFAVGAGLVLGERLTLRGWVGAALILAAIEFVLVKARADDTIEAEAVTAAH